MKSLFAVFVTLFLLAGCASTPTYTVLTQEGDVYQATNEPTSDGMGYTTFNNKKGKKVRIKEDDVKSISEN